MTKKLDAKQTEIELEILYDQQACVQEGKKVDSLDNEIEMSAQEIGTEIQRLLSDYDDETYPKD